ncbi:uroporphyrinogen-III C-methyltransferase [Metallosphaera sedula]|uniref:uroporphyrinogen-III C-methyltransferase n=3 Tax=Metallosphaera TaxID=41980 RepID=A4YED1_METS5|nr:MULTISPECIES: uroporphyrinogen-III C-methyltransferase [Metallosphaera]ABP94783.1 uroporphyrinogen-III C-methyltransferase [Metallosphaera sedula DSM 5348]AIM26770.1 uroporphyrinogen-III C-methyltransferase [Metallosphaera sedula]AKV73723.1 uroporphyrin-III methyltransferase [Metallosphaera sedula]AKV75963.1 uroporphyrin-III methyltransferase [Metallosphaera sedula]AKV78214.1 uroporphyrin-III methyltransferase [Metallosphaera sedula]
MKGRVALVGAGPGDPGLITVKGLQLLGSCDVVVYDRLVSEELLKFARKDAELIYAGKNLGESLNQSLINEILLQKALEGKFVVRLKGGDPYVFGRGEEECSFLLERGVDCEVVPGVTSAVAVPAYAGIPVTSRWFSSGFCVVTGSKADGSSIDPDYIPKKGTLVIMMGVSRVEDVKRAILKVRDPGEPVAVIERGTTPSQRVVECTLEKLDLCVRENGISSPAIIVVGEVVKLRNKLWNYHDTLG